MKPIVPALSVVLLTACQVAISPEPKGSASPRASEATARREVRPAASARPATEAAPTSGGVPDPKRRLAGLLAALRDAQASRELARANDLISDRGGGLVSKIRTGIVANNGGSIVANNGGNIVANNGGALISDRGGGVVGQNGGGLASDRPAGFTLAQAPAPTPTPPVFKVIRSEDPPFFYLHTFYLPLFAGHIVGYDLADFKARGEAATEVERYAWDDVPFEPLARDPGMPYDLVRAHFGVRVERSRRLAFTTRIDIDFDLYIKQPMPQLVTAFKAMQSTFVMAVPDGQGGTDEMVVRARDYVYPPGAGPGETPDGYYPIPSGFAGDGATRRGKLTVQVSSPPTGDVTAVVASTFERTGGGAVKSSVTTYVDGRREEQVTDPTTGLRLELRYALDGAGTGEVREAGGAVVVGKLSWDAAGKGTLALDGEAESPIQLR